MQPGHEKKTRFLFKTNHESILKSEKDRIESRIEY